MTDIASEAVLSDLPCAIAPPAAPQSAFDGTAFDAARAATIKASRCAGNVHLDQVPPYVEAMRGREIFYVHDRKVHGIVRTVDTWQNVYVDWADTYSAEKELASPVRDGKKTIFRSALGPLDLKDYSFAQPAATFGGTVAA